MKTLLRVLAILYSLTVLAPHVVRAQDLVSTPPATFSVLTDREPIVSLIGKWRFHTGDNPHFADATFDDSPWELLDSDRSFSEQGHKDYSGFAWYRFQIVLPAGNTPYSLLLPAFNSAYQCFVNGDLLHSSAGMPPSHWIYSQTPVIVPLPSTPRPHPQTLTVAIRVWHAPIWANYVGGGPEPNPDMERVGPTTTINGILRQHIRSLRLSYSDYFDLAALDVLAGLASLALFSLRRSEREYLWFGIAVLASAIPLLFGYFGFGKTVNVDLYDGLELAARTVSRLAYLAFYLRLLGGRKSWFLRFVVLCLFLNAVPLILLIGFDALSVGTASLLGTLCSLPYELWVLAILIEGWRKRVTDARLLLLPVFLVFALNLFDDTLNMFGIFNHPLNFSLRTYTIREPFPITLTDLAAGFFLLAMLAILINRFARTRRQQDRTDADLEAARSLQQVIIPESIPVTPGLTIATAYHPAQEVGGDFFQIIPLASGDTLIVLGDVSGKGLPAAMTVSLAVGAVRALADFTTSPADLLAGLNRRLYGRGAGFTTCIILLISDSGLLTLANAGHLAPYLNGQEIDTEPALPLGLDPDATFSSHTLQLAPGDHITLLTDGVPEATSNHQLFGFPRTQDLSLHTAARIAGAALAFGQSDDITVLTIDVLAAA